MWDPVDFGVINYPSGCQYAARHC